MTRTAPSLRTSRARRLLTAVLVVAGLTTARPADAANYYWQTNGSTNTWSSLPADNNWSTTASPTAGTSTTSIVWADANAAFFAGTTDTTITVSGTVAPTSIIFTSAQTTTLTLAGGTINYGSALGVIDSSGAGTTTARNYLITSALTGTGGLTIAANGDRTTASGGGNSSYLQLGGNNTGLTGGITVTAGLVDVFNQNAVGANQITLNGGGLLDANRNITLTNSIVVGANGGTVRGYGAATTILSGVISSTTTTGVLLKTDSGTLVLNAANTYTGGTNVGAGAVRVTVSDSAFGTGTVTVSGNATVATSNAAGSGARSLANTFVVNSGVTLTLDGGFFTLTLAGPVGGAGGVARTSSGTVVLAGNNTYAGATTASSVGTLQIGNGGATGTLGAGAVTLGNAGSVLAFNRTGTVAVSNAISGAGSVSINGGLALTFGGATTYTGATTVTAGTLNLITSLASAVTVANGSTLTGTGTTTGAITLNAGSTVVGGMSALTGSGVTVGTGVAVLGAGAAPTAGNTGVTMDVVKYSGTTAPTTAANLTTAAYRSGAAVTLDTTNKKITLTYTADVKTWDPAGGTGSGTWDVGTTASWTGAVDSLFYAGDAVTFGEPSAAATVTLAGTLTPAAVAVANTTNTCTFSGGGRLAGSGALTKTGAGTLLISTANLYTGGTTVSGGVVRVGNTFALGTGPLAVGAGASVDLNGTVGVQIGALSGAGTVTNTATTAASASVGLGNVSSQFDGVVTQATGGGAVSLVKIGTGTLILNGTNGYSGGTTISAGTLQVGSGGTTGTLGTGAVTNNAALVFNRSDAVAVSNVISGTGSLSYIGAGTLTLSGGNSYTGGTTVASGTVVVNNANAIGGVATTTHSVTVTGGQLNLGVSYTLSGHGNLLLNGGNLAILRGTTFTADPFQLIFGANNGTVTSYGSTGAAPIIRGFDVNSSDIAVSANVTGALIDSTVAISTSSFGISFTTNAGSSLTVAGVISGTGQANNAVGLTGQFVGTDTGALYKLGAGTLTLTGASTFTGTVGTNVAVTSVQAGTLVLAGGNNRLPVGSAVYLGLTTVGGKLALAGVNQTVTGLKDAGTGTTANAVVGGSATLSTLIVNNTNAYTFRGVLGGPGANENNLALTKSGAGTLTLTAANTYTGPTNINTGVFALGSAGSLAASPLIVVGSGATFNVASVTTGVNSAGGAFSTAAGQTLSGAGTVAGVVGVAADSSIRGGAAGTTGAAGTLTATGNVTLVSTASANAVLRTEVTNTSAASVLSLTGATLGTNGVLNLGGGSGGAGSTTGTGTFTIDLVNNAASPIYFNTDTPTTYTVTIASLALAENVQLNGVSQPNGTVIPYSSGAYTLTSSNGSFTQFDNSSAAVSSLSVVDNGTGGSNLQLTFTPTPEPGTVLGLAAGGLGLAGVVRRLRATVPVGKRPAARTSGRVAASHLTRPGGETVNASRLNRDSVTDCRFDSGPGYCPPFGIVQRSDPAL